MTRLFVIALALAPAVLRGQRLEYLGGGVGLLAPTGSFGGVDKAGWQVSALGIARLKGSLHVVLDALYGQTAHQGGVAGHSTLAGGTVNGALFLAGDTRRVRPFVMAGAGFFRVNVDVPGFGSAAATKFAPGAGAGVLVGSGRRRGFLLARYVSVKTSPQGTSFIPISVGVVLTLGSP
jgi:hypothetical protein